MGTVASRFAHHPGDQRIAQVAEANRVAACDTGTRYRSIAIGYDSK